MIGFLKGLVEVFGHNCLLLIVGNIGYKVFVPAKLLNNLSGHHQELSLYINTHVKEDCQDLYGFLTKEELFLFELLIEVSGVGPKTALLIMEKGEKEIKQAIISSDVDFFTNIPRIGKKNAQKIIIELKGKLGSLAELDLTDQNTSQNREVIEALSSMGFKRNEVREILQQLPKELTTTEQKVKEALKRLGKR